MLKSWILQLFWHKNDGIAGWCEIKTHKYEQDSPPTKYVAVEKKMNNISPFCTCYKSLVSSAQKTRKKGKKVVKTNNGGNLCSLFPLIQIKKANNFLPMHDCCTINNFQRLWFRVCNMHVPRIWKLPATTISILHFIGKVTVNRRFDSFKGQEISKAFFLETPLLKKRPKFVEGFLP